MVTVVEPDVPRINVKKTWRAIVNSRKKYTRHFIAISLKNLRASAQSAGDNQ